MQVALKEVSRICVKEYTRRGYQLFEKPARQLFSYNARNALVVHPDAQHNAAILARLILGSPMCRSGAVDVRQSLKKNRDFSLLHLAGCKVICVVRFEGTTSELVAFALVMNFKEECLEEGYLGMLERANVPFPQNGLYLELICALPGHRAMSLTIMYLLKFLGGKYECIVTNPVNEASKKGFYTRHHFEALVPGTKDIAVLTRRQAHASLHLYYALLPGYAETVRMCTRGGIRDRSNTYWDCQ